MADDCETAKTCRICHGNETDEPNARLIRPCLCKGSQSYVHTSCLQTWRATSDVACKYCPVCKYEYRTIELPSLTLRSKYDWKMWLVSIIMFMNAIPTIGLIFSLFSKRTGLDVISLLYHLFDVSPIWRLDPNVGARSATTSFVLLKVSELEKYMSVVFSPQACDALFTGFTILGLCGLCKALHMYFQVTIRAMKRHHRGGAGEGWRASVRECVLAIFVTFCWNYYRQHAVLACMPLGCCFTMLDIFSCMKALQHPSARLLEVEEIPSSTPLST